MRVSNGVATRESSATYSHVARANEAIAISSDIGIIRVTIRSPYLRLGNNQSPDGRRDGMPPMSMRR